MRIYIKMKKFLRENNPYYENVTFALFCYQNDFNKNTYNCDLNRDWMNHGLKKIVVRHYCYL